jgi:hypothetical protein
MKRLQWNAGDLVFFSGRSFVSRVIRLRTCSRFSHVGIVAPLAHDVIARRFLLGHQYIAHRILEDWDERPLLFESTTLGVRPCEIAGRRIEGLQAHDPDRLIDEYDGRVYRMSLRPCWALSVQETLDLAWYLISNIGRRYDTGGALLAGTRLLKHLLTFRASDRRTVFCNELVGVALQAAYRHEIKRARNHPLHRSRFHPGRMHPGSFARWARKNLYEPLERIK